MADPLFSPLTIRGITLKNRIAVSPMCEQDLHGDLPALLKHYHVRKSQPSSYILSGHDPLTGVRTP
ncbi:MAG: hypothetical protein M3Y30_06990 [Gemmatimonadota bacterium]|nr:hypothetical protein [Gemmatimonadota bacterium]